MKSISHDLAEETPEAKARWSQSLTLAEVKGICKGTVAAIIREAGVNIEEFMELRH